MRNKPLKARRVEDYVHFSIEKRKNLSIFSLIQSLILANIKDLDLLLKIMAASMGFLQGLYCSNINPSNHKSVTLPLLNIKDKYGRTFHLSWIGFFVAFLSWFAFPPLIHGVVEKDLQLNQTQIANSNIIALLATLLVRLIVGPLCDRYGPRLVMVGCLLAGAIPTALTPLIKNATGLIIIRFFVGILGGTFVPCQVWTSQFFDRTIVGRVNALAAGWGNAGGGVTFYLMPAVVSSLIDNSVH